jgi:hypothetical protein
MDDHFWPSVYPGLIVGALIGLSAGTVLATLVGAAGGLAGAFAAFYLVNVLAIEPGLVPLAAIIIGAAAGAKLLTVIALKLTSRAPAS